MFGAKKIKGGVVSKKGGPPPKPICKQSWRLRGGLPNQRQPPGPKGRRRSNFAHTFWQQRVPRTSPASGGHAGPPGQCCKRAARSSSPPGGGGRLRTVTPPPQGPQYFKKPGWRRASPPQQDRPSALAQAAFSCLPAGVASVWPNGDPSKHHSISYRKY